MANSQRSAETRRRLMEAAVECFSLTGFDAASVDDVCAKAGVSKGAFYYHFESKQELFLALLRDWLATLDQAMERGRKDTVPETLVQMTKMLPLALGSTQNRFGMWLEFWLQATRDKVLWKATIAPYRHYRDMFSRMIEQGIAEGSIRKVDPQAAAQAILSMSVGLFLQSVLDPKGADWQATAQHSVEILMSGLLKSEA